MTAWKAPLAAVLVFALAIRAGSDEQPTAQFALELRDGSKLVGTLEPNSLPIQNSFTQIDLASHLVDSIDFRDDRETVTISLISGDRLSGFINLKDLAVRTAFGRVKIPMASLRRMEARLQVPTDGLMA